MKINVIIIDKKGKDNLYAGLVEHYKKISKPFAKVEVIEVFDKEIAKAQDISPQAAQKSYLTCGQHDTPGSESVCGGCLRWRIVPCPKSL